MPVAPRALKYRAIGAPYALRSMQQLRFTLDKLTLRAARSGPIIVELYVPDAGWMRIGLGLSKSILTFRPPEGAKKAPKPSRSVSWNGGNDDIVYWTWCEDHRHGYERRQLIESRSAVAAFEHFFQTGELSPNVKWETFKPGLV